MRAIYVRTSPGDNDGAAQLHQLRQWCVAQGWRDVREYVDRDVSGTKDSRPEWNRLREHVRSGKISELAATELSRLGRSVLNVVLALDELHRAGCRVVLLREALDYGTPVGRAVATIMAAIAQLERDRIVERITAGVRRAQVEGTRSGRAIGRPRREIDDRTVERAIEAMQHAPANIPMSWRLAAEWLDVPTTSLRRAVEAYQKRARNESP